MSDSIDTVAGRFADKTVIVTGAGSGIGRSTALRLAREGARVVVNDIAKARLDELVAANPALSLVPVVADVSTEDGAQAVVATAGGRVDGLANVAGIMDGFLPVAELDDATWERVLAVNLTGPMRLTRAVLPIMIAAGGGSIVNISSEASLRASCSGVTYAVSKQGINALTRSTAALYAKQGIRANAVAPGGVETGIEAPFKSEHAAAVLGPLMGAMVSSAASPEQLAATITYLLSDDASNVNGVVLPCDGGWSVL